MSEFVISASFSGGGLTAQLLGVRMVAKYGTHDVAVLTYPMPRRPSGLPLSSVPAEGTPVTTTVGRGPWDLATWSGYVHHYTVRTPSGAAAPLLDIVCIGTSLPMATQRARALTGTTITDVALDVARQWGFRALVSQDDYVHPLIVQDGRSDFQMLNDLAARSNMRLWVSGGVLTMVRPGSLIVRRALSSVQPFSTDGARALISFETVASTALTLTDGTPASTTVYGLGTDLKPLSVTRDTNSFLGAVDTSRDVRTLGDAIAVAGSAVSPFSTEAQAVLAMAHILRPGMVLSIRSAIIAPEHQGAWLVTGVDHTSDSVGTTSTVSLARASATAVSPDPARVISTAADRADVSLQGTLWRSTAPGVEYV